MTWTSDCGTVRLYCGDCLDVLPTLEAGSVDAVVTSPPYNQRLDKFKPSGFKAEGNSQWASRVASSYFDSMPEDEYQNQQQQMLNACFTACASHASIFYNHKIRWRDKKVIHPIDIVRRSNWNLRQEIIWLRDGSVTQNAKMFPPCQERIYWMFKDFWKWNDDANKWLSVWKIQSDKMSQHPVAYPVEITYRAISATTEHLNTVLDPYCGSGTTGVAAVRLGRKFIGIELDPRYFELAKRRIEGELKRFPLFEQAEGPKQGELFAKPS